MGGELLLIVSKRGLLVSVYASECEGEGYLVEGIDVRH